MHTLKPTDDSMLVSRKKICEELLWDLIHYELYSGRIGLETKHMLQMHLEQCPDCRKRMGDFFQLVGTSAVERNFG
jgi:hypothetical protein